MKKSQNISVWLSKMKKSKHMSLAQQNDVKTCQFGSAKWVLAQQFCTKFFFPIIYTIMVVVRYYLHNQKNRKL
jgi:Trk-type K+ transport system membrane component